MVSNPITCCSVMRWASTPRGMECPQHKKTEGAFRPLERGEQCQLVPQPVFALTQRADASSDRGHMLADVEIEPLHEGRVDLAAERRQDIIDSVQSAKDHAVRHIDQAPAPHGLDLLRIQQPGLWHPAGFGSRTLCPPARRLHPLAVVRQ